VRELQPFVTVREMNMLESGGERVARLHLTLDRIGRRRPTTTGFAAVTVKLRKALERWCAEIELAGRGIHLDTLPAAARRVLEQRDPLEATTNLDR
jgi:hypothetical protein